MLAMMSSKWWILLLRGILFILMGILAIVMPGLTLFTLICVYGIFTAADGLSALMLGFGGGPDGKTVWPMVGLGIMALLAGIIAFVYPGITALVFLVIIAVSLIFRGLFELIAAIMLRKEIDDEWVIILSGLLSIGLGVMLLARPMAGLEAFVILIGAIMFFLGTLSIALSLRLRGLHKKLTPPPA